jgi:hypothetical protein
MKKSVYLFSISLFLLATATGCSDWGEEPELSILELESANVSFDTFGGSGEIVVRSTAGVTASSAATWCVTTVSGNKVTVTVPPYGELLGRATVVTLVSGRKKVPVPVTQSGMELKIESKTVELPGTASDTTLQVNCPLPVTPQSSATWLVAGITAGNILELHATANDRYAPRAATVTLTGGDLTVAVTVTQKSSTARLTFNDCIGTWTFSSTTGTSSSGRTSKTALVTDEGGYLKVALKNGSTPTSTVMFYFEMRYDATTGKVNIPAQKIHEDGGVDVILTGFNGGTGIVFDGGMDGSPTGGTLAKPVLSFTSDGTAANATFSYIGFILIKLPNYIYIGFGSSDSITRYTNITMTKQ